MVLPYKSPGWDMRKGRINKSHERERCLHFRPQDRTCPTLVIMVPSTSGPITGHVTHTRGGDMGMGTGLNKIAPHTKRHQKRTLPHLGQGYCGDPVSDRSVYIHKLS